MNHSRNSFESTSAFINIMLLRFIGRRDDDFLNETSFLKNDKECFRESFKKTQEKQKISCLKKRVRISP